jgi:hypothetical protein
VLASYTRVQPVKGAEGELEHRVQRKDQRETRERVLRNQNEAAAPNVQEDLCRVLAARLARLDIKVKELQQEEQLPDRVVICGNLSSQRQHRAHTNKEFVTIRQQNRGQHQRRDDCADQEGIVR